MLYFPAPPSFYWWSSIIHSHMYFKLIALMSIIRLRISLYQFNIKAVYIFIMTIKICIIIKIFSDFQFVKSDSNSTKAIFLLTFSLRTRWGSKGISLAHTVNTGIGLLCNLFYFMPNRRLYIQVHDHIITSYFLNVYNYQ